MRPGSIYRNSVASTMSLILAAVTASTAVAQEADDASSDDLGLEEIVVTGIRGSLKQAMDVKRDARGIVDAISAEDFGKFPDTNLAESLQRITGVSIDRVNGEGSKVTVRGFGPDFNLVTLNGRQMPTSGLEDTTASSSRSFDFANIAAEGISGVQVYKTGRASVPTGGIGSTINISTTRPLDAPGMKATIGAKAVMDTSDDDGTSVTPEISGLYSNTFADDKFGVAVTGSYQKRKSGYNQASAGWRGAFEGTQNDWGTLPQIPDGGTEADINVTNRPGAGDYYSTTQNMAYSMTGVDRERINGQLTMQFRPVDTITATADYTYSQNKLATERHDMSVWFNHGATTSAWTDGPVAGPLLYSEDFGASPSDLSFGGVEFATKNENKSLGFNVEWTPTDNIELALDYHNSSAESGADSPYGSNVALGTASFTLQSQSIDFSEEFPVLSLTQIDGLTGVDPSRIVSTGSSFRNSYMRTDIEQVQFNGSWHFDEGIVESIDFGASYTENKVRSAYANVQRDTWGGAGPASDLPDDIFEVVSVADKFDSFDGSDNAALFNEWVIYDFETMVGLVDSLYGACGGNGQCASSDWQVDRRTTEETFAAYFQVNASWEISGNPLNVVAGLRYEDTDVTSRALVPIATGTQWVAANEAVVVFSPDQDFTELTGGYDNWLPSIDVDFSPLQDVVLRASYSKTIARPNYADIQGGQTINNIFRIGGGTGSQGNPGLLPFESTNWDFSAEWYYDDASYFAVGYFNKKVKNFIGTETITATPFSLPNPFGGQRYNDAVAAVGSDDLVEIRNWIFANADPSTVEITGVDSNGDTTGNILGVAGEDPTLEFVVSVPSNQRSAKLNGWEFALQHTFGDSGFGAILNYTIVNGDVGFNDLTDWNQEQFALYGLSDTANVVGFYDKDGLQVRVAYNWRDKFLSGIIQGEYAQRHPNYVEAYGQFDINVSYDVNDQITVFAEGINVTGATQRSHVRSENTVLWATQAGARYNLGVRYKF